MSGGSVASILRWLRSQLRLPESLSIDQAVTGDAVIFMAL